MNVFNRGFMIILLLALATLAVSLAVLTWVLPTETIEVFDDAVDWLEDDFGDPEKIMFTTGALLVALVSVLFLMLELLPKSSREVKVTDLQGGDAYLSAASIGQRIEEAVSRVHNVTDVKAYVQPKGKGVTVTLDLHVDPQANVAVVTDDACRTTRDILSNQVHVALVEPPFAHLHYREMNLARSAPRRQPVNVGAPVPVPAAAGGPSVAPERPVFAPSLPSAPERRRSESPPPSPASPSLPRGEVREPEAVSEPPRAEAEAPAPEPSPSPEISTTPETPRASEPPRSPLPPSPIDAPRIYGRASAVPPEPQPGEAVNDEYGRRIGDEPRPGGA